MKKAKFKSKKRINVKTQTAKIIQLRKGVSQIGGVRNSLFG